MCCCHVGRNNTFSDSPAHLIDDGWAKLVDQTSGHRLVGLSGLCLLVLQETLGINAQGSRSTRQVFLGVDVLGDGLGTEGLGNTSQESIKLHKVIATALGERKELGLQLLLQNVGIP